MQKQLKYDFPKTIKILFSNNKNYLNVHSLQIQHPPPTKCVKDDRVVPLTQHGLHSDGAQDEVSELHVSILATVPHDQSTECPVTQAET